jgi:hypothetical protein
MSSPFGKNVVKKNITSNDLSDPREQVKAKILKKGNNNSKSANVLKK